MTGMRVVEYKTAVAEDGAELDREVNKLIGLGYQLYGSPYASGKVLAQAMVKHGLRDGVPPVEAPSTTSANLMP
jgi:hypothetical protein